MRRLPIALFATLLTALAQAQTTVPNTFVAGSPARAADVNANFTSVVNAINALATRVGNLENPPVNPTALAGTYGYQQMTILASFTAGTGGAQTTIGANDVGSLTALTESGNVTLMSNGTWTSANIVPPSFTGLIWNGGYLQGGNTILTQGGVYLATGGGYYSSFWNGGGTWTLSGSTITLTASSGGTLNGSVGSGGHSLVASGIRSGGAIMVVLTR